MHVVQWQCKNKDKRCTQECARMHCWKYACSCFYRWCAAALGLYCVCEQYSAVPLVRTCTIIFSTCRCTYMYMTLYSVHAQLLAVVQLLASPLPLMISSCSCIALNGVTVALQSRQSHDISVIPCYPKTVTNMA